MDKVRQFLEKINIRGELRLAEPMSEHTSFRVGGPADVFAKPSDTQDLLALLQTARNADLPVHVLGGGANLLVSDSGIRGLVVDMGAFTQVDTYGSSAFLGAGMPVGEAAAVLADQGFGGIDFLYAMPGSVGGALWMNARCYGSSVSDVLLSATVVDEVLRIRSISMTAALFDYKVSPFQNRRWVILDAMIRTRRVPSEQLWRRMRDIEADRRNKGHFDAPSAGSVFKNNPAFGEPTGVLIDRLGLKGFSVGKAGVSLKHGNIVVNRGGASAADVLSVIRHLENEVHRAYGYRLEREVLVVGDWPRDEEV